MSSTRASRAIPPSADRKPIALDRGFVTVDRNGQASEHSYGDGAPPSVEGVTVGAAVLPVEPFHGGELHPDGDEILYLVSGRASVLLEEASGDTLTPLAPGEAFVVPRGVWHQVVVAEPSHVVYVTPGPRVDHRPLPGR